MVSLFTAATKVLILQLTEEDIECILSLFNATHKLFDLFNPHDQRSLPRSFLASGRFNASFVILLLFIGPHRIKSNPIYDFLIDPRRDYVLVAIHRNSCQQPSEKMGSKGIYGKLRTVIITSSVRQKQSSSGKGIIRWDWDRVQTVTRQGNSREMRISRSGD